MIDEIALSDTTENADENQSNNNNEASTITISSTSTPTQQHLTVYSHTNQSHQPLMHQTLQHQPLQVMTNQTFQTRPIPKPLVETKSCSSNTYQPPLISPNMSSILQNHTPPAAPNHQSQLQATPTTSTAINSTNDSSLSVGSVLRNAFDLVYGNNSEFSYRKELEDMAPPPDVSPMNNIDNDFLPGDKVDSLEKRVAALEKCVKNLAEENSKQYEVMKLLLQAVQVNFYSFSTS